MSPVYTKGVKGTSVPPVQNIKLHTKEVIEMLQALFEFLWEIGEFIIASAITLTFTVFGYLIALFPPIMGGMGVLFIVFIVILALFFIYEAYDSNYLSKKRAAKKTDSEREAYLADLEVRLDAVAANHPEKYTKEQWKEKFRKVDYAAFLPENSGRPHGPLIEERLMLEELRIGDPLMKSKVWGNPTNVRQGYSYGAEGFGGPQYEMRFAEVLMDDLEAGYISASETKSAMPNEIVFDSFDWEHPLFQRYNNFCKRSAEEGFAASGDITSLNVYHYYRDPFTEKKEAEYVKKQETKRLQAQMKSKLAQTPRTGAAQLKIAPEKVTTVTFGKPEPTVSAIQKPKKSTRYRKR